MSLPGNGIFVIRGEISTLMTAMRRGTRWNSLVYVDEEKDALIKMFIDLKQTLNRIEDLRSIEPNVFLAPFLEVIRTDETTGIVTSLALSAINKFLSYGLIDPTCPNLAVTVENIVDAVTHARFMGTDQSTDGVTLFRVVEVLHTLMRSPEGSMLTNEAVCEVMLSCFKICFEPRLNELLRRYAEQALKDMVLLLFMRLPQFSEDKTEAGLLKKFQMMAVDIEQDKRQGKNSKGQIMQSTLQCSNRERNDEEKPTTGQNIPINQDLPKNPQTPEALNLSQLKVLPLATTPITPAGNILDMQGKITQTPSINRILTDNSETLPSASIEETNQPYLQVNSSMNSNIADLGSDTKMNATQIICGSSEYINSVGVRFTHQHSADNTNEFVLPQPYGLPCVQELFRFLILLCNPVDKQNTDSMMHMGLSLLNVAFEVGADSIGKYYTLLELVKDDLCRNLITLMNSERLTIFAANLQLCFLLFESLRGHLKFQMEAYLKKLSAIIASDNPRTQYEVRELALDNLLQLWRLPGFVAELYINYDCDLYCSDIFESLTNVLSKYTLSATNVVYSTHIMAMDTLISVIENIERNCVAAKNVDNVANVGALNASQHSHSRKSSSLEGVIVDGGDTIDISDDKTVVENISKFISNTSRLYARREVAQKACITREYLSSVKQKKRILTQGTELFNQRPDKGIQYLQDNGILKTQIDSMEVALFLRENPGLDKKMIGEYISRKRNVDSKILLNFVNSFDFTGLRVDQALRMYLETFRLPGEAPLIFLILEHFADHWHKQNNEPFVNTDAAFSLAYAIIMLNMDQHNSNAKRLNVPMTQEDFLKNLRGLNGGIDFDQDMLSTVFNAIKNEEIVMPAEQIGIVRENYLWKVLLRRGNGSEGAFNYVQDAVYDMEIFNIMWGDSLSALSFMFDKSNENGYQHTLIGFTKCAIIMAHYNMHDNFDALILTLCKFTTLLNTVQPEMSTQMQNATLQTVNFGLNLKAQSAMKTVFALVHNYGDCLRESWKNILDLFLHLFRLKLLPKSLVEVEDFCEANGKAQLNVEKPNQKQEVGLFSTWYSLISSDGQREPTQEELDIIKMGKRCIKECQLDQIIQESKFIQPDSLHELLKNVLLLIKAPNAPKTVGLPYAEDATVFWMELLVKIVIQNRDRMVPLWQGVCDQMYLLVMGAASCGYDYLLNRSIVAVLKLAIYLMRNEELCPIVLQSLKMLLMLKPVVILMISKQISVGIYELLKTSAQNIHSEQDWQIIFMILECIGAGAVPPKFDDTYLPIPNGNSGIKSDCTLSSEEDSGLPDRGYMSDSEIGSKQQLKLSNNNSPFPSSPTAENWILINKDTDLSGSRPQTPSSSITAQPPLCSLVYKCKLIEHSPFALFKCWDSLVFIVRNVAHITPYNFESCVRCIRTFVEACRDGGIHERRKIDENVAEKINYVVAQKKKSVTKRTQSDVVQRKVDYVSGTRAKHEDDDLAQRYETLSIQLLDLMYTLYTRTAQIFRWWAEESCIVPQCSALWSQGWCPLLQGIARLAMDRRREVRTYAISCLQQRALLMPDLQSLSGTEWAACFKQVLFPLLDELLPGSTSIAYLDPVLLEESRIRTATIMSKVFLHHLTPLIDLGPAFNELWIDVLDYIEKFMSVGSDMLSEQMQEILKNMLLVMHSVRVFHNENGTSYLPLWKLTWTRIGQFLPNLRNELFRDEVRAQQVTPSTGPKITPLTILANNENFDDPINASRVDMVATQQVHSDINISSLVESSKCNIILQPSSVDVLNDCSLILKQEQSIEKQVQTQSPLTSPIKTNSFMQQNMTKSIQPISIVDTCALLNISLDNKVLPDLVNDTSKILNMHEQQQKQEEKPNMISIELPQKISIPNMYGKQRCIELQFQSQQNQQKSQSLPYDVFCQTQQAQQVQQQSLQHHALYAKNYFNPSVNFGETHKSVSHVSQTATADTLSTLPTIARTTNVNVCNTNPIAHVDQSVVIDNKMTGDHVYSFAPDSAYKQSAASKSELDVRPEYILNPYNLAQQQLVTSTNNNIKQELPNYFSTNADPSSISPGSEMLYSQP